MGTWGTGISSNDTFDDITHEFFELYNEGLEPEIITSRLISENKDLIGEKEECNNFWFALASAQWECKALQPELLKQIIAIVQSGNDIALWQALGADKSELTKRRKVLDKFLVKLNTEKKSARRRKKKIFRDSIFQKGNCLTFKLENDRYGGAMVLESEQQTEYGMNLIAITTIAKPTGPTIKDFESADVLIQKEQTMPGKYVDREMVSWYYAEFYKQANTTFEVICQLEVKRKFHFDNDYTGSSTWDMIPTYMNRNEEFINQWGKPDKRLKMSRLCKKKWL